MPRVFSNLLEGWGMHKPMMGLAVGAVLLAGPALGGEVEVVKAEARLAAGGAYAFSVTLRHADEGWKHYANKWVVLAPDGRVLGERVLLHPHVDEQPFTRGLSAVKVPAGIGSVSIRAHDLKHGASARTLEVKLPGR